MSSRCLVESCGRPMLDSWAPPLCPDCWMKTFLFTRRRWAEATTDVDYTAALAQLMREAS